MQTTIKVSLLSILTAIIAVMLAVVISTSSAYGHETGEEHEHSEETAQPEESEEQNSESSAYTYSAQPGDSYTELARKAIQTYGINNNVNISQAGIVFAETNLTQEAGVGELAVGQEVSIKEELVKKWADAAAQLPEPEQKAWSVYVPFVNFNTDSVGQESS